MSMMDPTPRGAWLVRFGLVAALAVGGYVVYRVFVWPRIHAEKIFAGRIPDWNAVDFPPSRDSVREGETPYRTGRVFVLRLGRGNRVSNSKFISGDPFIDPVWYRLSDAVRARTPEEAATLILVCPATLPHDRQSLTVQGSQTTIESEHISQVVPLRVYDLKGGFLIGTCDLVIVNAGDYETPLRRFVETMPVR